MPVNRNALIRYRTLDNCLRNKYKKYTLEDLVDACSEALYEYEGIDKGVSRRTVQMDIQLMRSDKLGYNAPIVIQDKKYYIYEDPEYSITNIPLTDQDLGKLTEVVEILKQFKGFSHFQDLSGMVQKLENKIHTAKTSQEPVIDFEKNENLKGLEYIDPLYQAIINKCAVELGYQSFKAREANTFKFHPYYLKEYRNRWFVLGIKKRKEPVLTLALDRITDLKPCSDAYIIKKDDFQIARHLNDVLGVTVNPGAEAETVTLLADPQTAPYILTKPIHHSQQVVEKLPNGVVLSLRVQLNFELEREILGFGERVKVLGPERLKRRIKDCLEQALDLYQFDMSESALAGALQKLTHRGSMTLHHVFSKKEVHAIKTKLHQYFKTASPGDNVHAVRDVLQQIPDLTPLLLTPRLIQILKKINPNLFLTKAIFFDKTPEANWYVTWHQDLIIQVKEKIDTEGFSGWTRKQGVHGVCPPEAILNDTVTIRIHLDDAGEGNGALNIIPGSHHKKLKDEAIRLITESCTPTLCEVRAGGIHIMKPLLLHASSKATNQKPRKVLHLEFNATELPNGLQWAERVPLTQPR